MLWTPHPTPAIVMSINCILSSIQSFLAKLGLGHNDRAASLWMFFAACGIAELCISFLICTPLERFWPLTSWPKRNSIAADVAYAFFVRIVLFPLIAFFEYDWLRLNLDGFLRAHAVAPGGDPISNIMARNRLHPQFRRSRSRRLLASPDLSQSGLVVWHPLFTSCRRANDVLVR